MEKSVNTWQFSAHGRAFLRELRYYVPSFKKKTAQGRKMPRVDVHFKILKNYNEKKKMSLLILKETSGSAKFHFQVFVYSEKHLQIVQKFKINFPKLFARVR